MTAHAANLINGFSLIALGIWGYFGSPNPSPTAFIPVFVGGILLVMNKGIKNQNKLIGHIAPILTLLILIALVKPLLGVLDSGNNAAVMRIGIMMLTSAWSLVSFVRYFLEARKNRT